MSDYPEGVNPPSDNPSGSPYPGQPYGGSGQPVPRPAQSAGGSGAGASFNLSAISPGGLIAAAGGLVYVLFSFFPWYTVEWLGSINAWQRASSLWSVIIFGLVAVAFAVKALGVVPPRIPLEMILFGLVVAGDLFFLFAFFNGVEGPVTRGIGLWVGLLAAIAINVGAVLQFRKIGGLAAAQRGLGNMQQRAAGDQHGNPPGGYPQQPPQQPGPGGYPPPGGPQ